MFTRRFGAKTLPPGETTRPTDQQLALENSDLKQQVAFLTSQIQDLRLVEDERKRLGPLLQYFKPVSVIGGDSTPGRESLSIMPASGVDTDAGTAVMCPEGVVGRLDRRPPRPPRHRPGLQDHRRLRPLDRGPLEADRHRQGRLHRHRQRRDADRQPDRQAGRGPQGRRLGRRRRRHRLPQADERPTLRLIETIRPIPSKPLFAEIIVKPRTDLRKLSEVLVMRK